MGNKNNIDIYLQETFVHDLARIIKNLGFLSEKKYRTFCIKDSFTKKRKSGLTIEKAELELAEEYELEPTTIHSIIYRKK
jgi:hypothetical protein